ncbi:MAG: 50S ribosome-binding GTPase [Thiotrichales bacterium]|nr:50S ribosome-binding GTPase [Thiotrichales bacterium]
MWQKWKERLWISADQSLNLEPSAAPLPTLWLLGKTGAGKSSLVQAITGLDSVAVGNGFAPCTQTANVYFYPQTQPLMRFLDTRGLGEANYDAHDDVAQARNASHGLVVVAKLEEVEQSHLLHALRQINPRDFPHTLLLLTAAHSVKASERLSLQTYQHQQFSQAWRAPLPVVTVDFLQPADSPSDEDFFGQQALFRALADQLPILHLMLNRSQYSDAEQVRYQSVKQEILWYAGSAGAFDALPGLGLVSVPAVQALMLRNLAARYGIAWSRTRLAQLLAALGSSFALHYAANLGARQLGKLIPIYGQTAGAALASGVSFATTYALGRAACYYFYQLQHEQPISEETLRRLYREALQMGKKGGGNATS